jgi:serine/threonine protein kinase
VKICLSCEGVTDTSANRCGHCGAWLLPTDVVHYPVRRGESDAGNPLLGTVVDGKYRLQGVLGRGGLGTVFRAQHVGSLMAVALKLMHPRFAERPEYRRALLPEARRAATVVHERCARLLDAGETEDGVAWLAMELVEGETLDVVVRRGALAPSHAVDVLLQVAQALEAIHGVGLVHCDLSPRNVMVSPHQDGLRVKVLDFGIARSVSLAGPAREAGGLQGFVNPAFAAPELLAGTAVDARADLWSFGVLAWLLLTGGMPVDDRDPTRMVSAITAGELRPWPPGVRVGRRLVRLVQRCLALDPKHRPQSAAAVGRELAIVRGARRPLIARAASAMFGLGLVATIAGGPDAPPPFLQPLSGSQLEWVRGSLPRSQPVAVVPSRRLATLGFDYGGFAPNELRADLVRDGQVLLHTWLVPERGVAAGTLLLSTAQPSWLAVVQGLQRASADGPVDLVFVVPGAAPLGAMRARLDDAPPTLDVRFVGEPVVRADTRLAVAASDDIGLDEILVRCRLADGRQWQLSVPPTGGDWPLGVALAGVAGDAGELGAGELLARAIDRAGNERVLPPLPFASCDVEAPRVVEVTGPLGEPFVPAAAGAAKIRVRTSHVEEGCRLAITGDRVPALGVPLGGASTLHSLAITFEGEVRSGTWQFEIVDARGNRTVSELPIQVRDRSTRIAFAPGPGSSRQLGDELVIAEQPTTVAADIGPNWIVAGVRVELSVGSRGPAGDGVIAWSLSPPSGVQLQVPALPAGLHVLRIDLEEAVQAGERGLSTTVALPLRVLPAVVELRVPAPPSRFLPAQLQGRWLQAHGNGFVDGPAWGLDPAMRPYVRGRFWVGDGREVARTIAPAAPGEPLLPVCMPVPGHNRIAIELVDALDRGVRVLVGGAPRTPLANGHGPTVVADFWWHDEPPALVGEELLLEFGQQARVEIRCPLPYGPADAAGLRLGILQNEFPAAAIVTTGSTSLVRFELPFLVWRVAANLADATRDDFAGQIERRVDAYVVTPIGRTELPLRLRTTRSTLVPLTLAELGGLPPDLAAMRLLPVLAPPGPFAEPVPVDAPPRATFRPQLATAVRNLGDILLQDSEFTCGQARAVAALAAQLAPDLLARCVHHADPLGRERTQAKNLLPAAMAEAPPDRTLTEVTFFQAWALSRLLGALTVGDVAAFRLPLGCELELAAFGAKPARACHGAGSAGGRVAMAAFLAAGEVGALPSAAAARAAGDVVATAFGEPFVALDFGVSEWVLDLPHVAGAELLLGEWIGDRTVHLERVMELAAGDPLPIPGGVLQQFGVVRGLAAGQRAGLLDDQGRPLGVRGLEALPRSVPGVLRTEQLRRDGSHLLGDAVDPRLRTIGFRVVAEPERLAAARGRR